MSKTKASNRFYSYRIWFFDTFDVPHSLLYSFDFYLRSAIFIITYQIHKRSIFLDRFCKVMCRHFLGALLFCCHFINSFSLLCGFPSIDFEWILEGVWNVTLKRMCRMRGKKYWILILSNVMMWFFQWMSWICDARSKGFRSKQYVHKNDTLYNYSFIQMYRHCRRAINQQNINAFVVLRKRRQLNTP